MPRPPIDLSRKIKDILQHVLPLPYEARAPILHYQRTATDIWTSLAYIKSAVETDDRYPAVAERHLGRLYGMALVQFVETFERFLKEVAAECVDFLANFIIDDRFNVFRIQASSLASHFGTGTLGKSLCESSTWLDCGEITERFQKLLADPFQPGGKSFFLFPKQGQQPTGEQWRTESMSLIWQVRHTAVHNVGVITRSDAVKLRLLAKEKVDAPQILMPTRSDLTYLKQFIDETAILCNERIGVRLAELLTTIHGDSPNLFSAQETADRVASIFQKPLQISGILGIVPPN
jgi:hypothetical protein